MIGRPSKYTVELGQEILERLAKGEPLVHICRNAHMPHRSVVHDWREAHPEFGERYFAARDDGYDVLAADCLDIAEDGTNDWVEKRNLKTGEVTEVFNAEHVQRSKLRIETRLKLLAKWDSKRYGDRLALTGVDGEAPIATVLKVEFVKPD